MQGLGLPKLIGNTVLCVQISVQFYMFVSLLCEGVAGNQKILYALLSTAGE